MTWYIHVNRNQIDANTKHKTHTPSVRFQKGKHGKPVYCNEVQIPGPSRVIYSPHEPILPCGARLVIVSEQEPKVIN